jgi:hypothetical protein
MSSPTTLTNILQSVKDEVKDVNLDALTFIRNFNRFLFRMNLTKPAEQISQIFFVKDYEKYRVPSAGFREAIGIYSKTTQVVRYVSPLRFRLEDPIAAFTDQVDNGSRFLKIRNPYSNSLISLVTECDNLTADGAWVISGGSALAIDTTTKESGAGSLSFTKSATQCILTFTKTSAIDASTFTEFLRERLYAWLPVAPTSIKLRIGNDASNYYEQTITDQASGEAFITTDVNEIEFAQESATGTGTVDKTNLVWFQFEFNFAAATSVAQFRIDKIALAKPEKMDLEWYTNYVAMDANGVLLQSLTEDASTTDEPLIKNYPDYVNAAIDGLVYDYLKVPDPERAKMFYARYVGEKDANGKYINGMGYLDMRYPSRAARYKRMRTLPDLSYGTQRLSRNLYNSD